MQVCFKAENVGIFSCLFLCLGDKHVLVINMFITNGMYLSLSFFPCPETPMGIFGMVSFLVWSGGSNNFLALLGIGR